MNDGLHTLGRWPSDAARRTPTRIAVDDGTDRISYADLDRRADALAATLRASGSRPGDRIATLTGNSAAHIVLFFACARARLVLVPLSWRLAAREIAEQLAHAEPALFVVHPAHTALATAALARLTDPPPHTTFAALAAETSTRNSTESATMIRCSCCTPPAPRAGRRASRSATPTASGPT